MSRPSSCHAWRDVKARLMHPPSIQTVTPAAVTLIAASPSPHDLSRFGRLEERVLRCGFTGSGSGSATITAGTKAGAFGLDAALTRLTTLHFKTIATAPGLRELQLGSMRQYRRNPSLPTLACLDQTLDLPSSFGAYNHSVAGAIQKKPRSITQVMSEDEQLLRLLMAGEP
jgi:hypothetical protein